MWDFGIGRSLGLVLRTWPFVLLRMVVYFGITLAYVVVMGGAAGVGWGVGHIFADGGPEATAFWGAVIGFGLVSAIFYWVREYILYIVKAGHIAAMVQYLDGKPMPDGQGQIAYARAEVTTRFAEASVLFAVDQLVKGVLVTISRILGGVESLIPIPGLDGLLRFVNAVIRMALTYVDEIILAYAIRTQSRDPFRSAAQGVVLYAQNGRGLLKNALWLAVIKWVVLVVIFLFALAPAAALVYEMPGQLAGWAFVVAILFTWAFSAAFIEPFCIASLMQVYFQRIDGQTPNPEWDRRLTEASKHFRELKDKAAQGLQPGPAPRPAMG